MRFIAHHTIVPIRQAAADHAEMVSQMLFGETGTLVDYSEKWLKIRLDADGYEGWADRKMLLNGEAGTPATDKEDFFVNGPMVQATVIGKGVSYPVHLTYGCRIPGKRISDSGTFFLGVEGWTVEVPTASLTNIHIGDLEYMDQLARQFLGTPYLWGGRTFWGIDCSGYTQLLFRQIGIEIPRDSSVQVQKGKLVSFEESKPGDLAFFHNERGNITHVGLVTKGGKILHASGRVREDVLTKTGIFRSQDQTTTHQLHSIKRYIE